MNRVDGRQQCAVSICYGKSRRKPRFQRGEDVNGVAIDSFSADGMCERDTVQRCASAKDWFLTPSPIDSVRRWWWLGEYDRATSGCSFGHILPSRFRTLVVGVLLTRIRGFRTPISHTLPSRFARRPRATRSSLARAREHASRPARRAPPQLVGISAEKMSRVGFTELTGRAVRPVSVRAGDFVAAEAVSQSVGEPSGEPALVA